MGNVVSIFKNKVKKELVYSDRNPLYISHQTGMVSSSEDFATKLAKVQQSLIKINALMEQLKGKPNYD